ncbi:MAG TPA: M48 family metallopeptidase [Thermodesulfovibrionales bacterium]|nr:M48 family metallopeptidase [Thermodesulfovibrionales bacterium]
MLIILLLAYLFVASFGYWLQILNLRHLKQYGDVVPLEFSDYIDRDVLKKTRDYTVEHSRFSIIESIALDSIVILFFFFGGLFNTYNSWIVSLNQNSVVSGTLFFLFLTYAKTILSIPFDLYSDFRIENKYGFNTMTGRLWVSDFLKSIGLTTILLGTMTASAFFIITMSPEHWWFIVWLFFLVFSLLIMYISPYVIEPLFNKFTPLDDETLEGPIKELMKKAGIMVSRIFRIDASKRSRHTNAYFTGIGRVKRIILFDTLLEKLDREEILSVLAHEAGHWKKRHILKHIVMVEALSFIGLYLSFRIIGTGFLNDLFALRHNTIFASLLILGFIGGIVAFPFTPLMSYLSRKHEREADGFAAVITGNPGAMATSLIKLSKDNLSNLHPHPLYAAFYYSHPPVVQRVREIHSMVTQE